MHRAYFYYPYFKIQNAMANHYRYSLALLFLLALGAGCKNKALSKVSDPRINDIRVPKGFSVSIYADNVDNARSLCMGDKGTIFVGNRQGKKVYALVDENSDGKADKKYTIADG